MSKVHQLNTYLLNNLSESLNHERLVEVETNPINLKTTKKSSRHRHSDSDNDPQQSSSFNNEQEGWHSFDDAIGLASTLKIPASTQEEEQALQAREKLVKLALEKKSDENYRKLLAPEIRLAVLTAFDRNTDNQESVRYRLPESMRTKGASILVKKYLESLNNPEVIRNVNFCNEELKDQNLSFDKLRKFFQKDVNRIANPGLHILIDKVYKNYVKSAEEAFTKYCENENTYSQYIKDYYKKRGQFLFQKELTEECSTSMVDVVAKLLNMEITVCDSHRNGVIYQTKPYNLDAPSGQEVIINYNERVNYFNMGIKEDVYPRTDMIIDKSLSLSINEDKIIKTFKEEYKNLQDRYELSSFPLYPTSYTLAQFSKKAYQDYKKEGAICCRINESEKVYEKRLNLPPGWKLLTTATTTDNGYFGAAYWHPKYQQVVIAHRGTKPTNFNALFTNIKSVVLNFDSGQMRSASTFAYKVTAMLNKISEEYKVNFQLFFTGHSLGGWLAQITTFTTKYLTIANPIEKSSFFGKLGKNDKEGYHAHTVVFDSPGCYDKLLDMERKFNLRSSDRSIHICDDLDITTYLSAPNLVNTRNFHIGTKYRIFINKNVFFEEPKPCWRCINPMNWCQMLKNKLTVYTLKTHKMENILTAFDSIEGGFRKEGNRLAVQEMEDWPISGVYRTTEEYWDFFEWASKFNQYNPNLKGESFPEKAVTVTDRGLFSNIRYQPKDFDEQAVSMRVFTRDERLFLNNYFLFSKKYQKYFKPKELLETIKDEDIKDKFQNNLKHFRIIEKENIIRLEEIESKPPPKLQEFIPYIKWLLQIFPDIKAETKKRSSDFWIKNRYYEIETTNYIKKITEMIKISLDFKHKPNSNLEKFLDLKDQQKKIWHLKFDGNIQLGMTKLYKIFQNIKKHNKDKGYDKYTYTVIELTQLLNTNDEIFSLKKLLECEEISHHLLIIEYKEEYKQKAQNLFNKELFPVLKNKLNIKVIVVTKQGDTLYEFFREEARKTFCHNEYSETEEGLSWDELKPESQKTLLEKMPVEFQGKKGINLDQLIDITQKELMDRISPVVLIEKLIENKPLVIGKELRFSRGYNENFYIDRNFNQIVIKEDIFNAGQEFPDLLASTEEDFDKLCKQHSGKNIHCVERESSGKVIWQQSKGNLVELRKYIDTRTHPYSLKKLDDFLQQTRLHRVMLISDTAGTGKSTVLSRLSKQLKQKFPTHWVVRFNLNEHTNALDKQKKKSFTLNSAVGFLSKELKLETPLERALFKQCFEQNEKVKVELMLDGFDEISPNYEETVIDLLQALKKSSVEQLWVTTRPHIKKALEDNLQQLSYTLEPFSKLKQEEFLTKYWQHKLKLQEANQKERLGIYAKELINKLAESISDKEKEFTGIPLQTWMLADVYIKNGKVEEFCQSDRSKPELPDKLDLLDLYQKFLKAKYFIFAKKGPIAEDQQSDIFLNDIRINKNHQRLALQVWFTEEQVNLLQPEPLKLSNEQLARIGIARINDENKPQFIHRTFAEYFAAEFLMKQLEKQNKRQEAQDFLNEIFLNEILLGEDYQVIRAFLNGLLKKEEFKLRKLKKAEETLEHYGNQIDELWKEKDPLSNSDGTMLHRAVIEGNTHIISFLLDSLKIGEHTDTLNKLFIAKDSIKRTAFFLATCYQVEALEKLWEWGNQAKLSPKEMLLDNKDENGSTVFLIAAWGKQVGVFDKLWELGEKELSSEDFKELLLDRDNREQTAWHQAAKDGYVEVLKRLWEWGKETLSLEDFKNKLLLAKDKGGLAAWHFAAWGGQIGVLEKLWEWSEKTPSLEDFKEDFKNKILLDRDNRGQTAWHQAAKNGYIEVLEVLKKLWERGKETLSPEDFKEDFKNKLLLDRDKNKRTAFLLAADNGHIEVLKRLWEWGEETLSPEDLKNKLLLAKDDSEQTAFLLAAEKGHIELLDKLLKWSQKTLNPREFKEIMRFVFFLAAEKGHVELLDKLFEWRQTTLNSQEFKKLLLDKDNFNQTIWSRAIENGHAGVLEKLWGWGENMEISQKELKERLLDKGRQRNAWRRAAKTGRAEVFDELLKWSQAKLSSQELKELLIVKDIPTSWGIAMKNGHLGLLEKLWEWSQETLNPQQLKEMLLNRYEYEQTAFHLTVKFRKVAALEKLWEWGKDAKLNTKELKEWISHHDMNGTTALELARIYTQGSIIYVEKQKRLEIINLLNRYSSD